MKATSGSNRKPQEAAKSGGPQPGRWTFISSHAAVLLYLTSHPEDTMASMAETLAMTERTTAGVIADLRQAGYVTVTKHGRRNRYKVNWRKPLRRRGFEHLRIRDLTDALHVIGAQQHDRR